MGKPSQFRSERSTTRTCASGDSGIGPSPRKPLVYVVDDDYDVRTSLRFLLETEGFDVRTFRNGAALLGSATRNRADCLVVDYKMADLDGLELAIGCEGSRFPPRSS